MVEKKGCIETVSVPELHGFDDCAVFRGHNYPGRLVSFEGRDHCGKSDQYRMFTDYLKRMNFRYVNVREPGGTSVGEDIRKILLRHDLADIRPNTELLLFESSRGQLFSEIIIPALSKGEIVVADRLFDSTTAYQGAAGKVPLHIIYTANWIACNGVRPDLTNVFDVTPETALKREGPTKDRIESKGHFFQERVRQAYLGISKLEPDRVKVIDANSEDKEEIHKEVVTHFENMIRLTEYQK